MYISQAEELERNFLRTYEMTLEDEKYGVFFAAILLKSKVVDEAIGRENVSF